MKSLLLAGAAFAALISGAQAADLAVEPTDIWSGYFVGVQGGFAWHDVSADLFYGGVLDDDLTFDPDGAVGGLYYGRNWQSGSWVFGLDSSISFIGVEESATEADGNLLGPAQIDDVEIEADFLGLSRLKVGYAFDNFMIFAAGGLATTRFAVRLDDIDTGGLPDKEKSWAFGWTVGAGIETKFSEHWSARVEYIYAKIEGDDFTTLDGVATMDADVELETQIVRGGIAYHF